MLKTIKTIALFAVILLTLNACESESKKDINRFIEEMNSEYGYELNAKDFFAEKKQNIIYHTMTDSNTLFSLYSNKNGEIIQCTLSSFDAKNEKNYKFLTAVGTILTNKSTEALEVMLKNAEKTEKYSEDGWTVLIIKNDLAVTYVINQTSSDLYKNNKPTLKDTSNDIDN